jgi:catechol 2,3-dioxygenase-like lactoylglutathione lyase family enzyme
MLATSPLVAFAATARPEQARAFYRDVLRLPMVEESPFALVFDCGGTMLRVQKVERVEPPPHTVLGWSVADVAAEVEALAARGIRFQRYPGMEQDAAGVWTSPAGARIAWFADPDGSTLSLTQLPAARHPSPSAGAG